MRVEFKHDNVTFRRLEFNPDETGDRAEYIWAAIGPTREEVDRAIEYEFPVTHCQHSYDCCGHLYQHHPPELFPATPQHHIAGIPRGYVGVKFRVKLYRNV